MHQLFSGHIDMASRLIVRGANIDYVNSNGYSALYLCVENMNYQAVKFLLQKGADPHIMDQCGFDACDRAKNNGMISEFKQFQDCSISKKIFPLLPDGSYPKFQELIYYKRVKELKDKSLLQELYNQESILLKPGNNKAKNKIYKKLNQLMTVKVQRPDRQGFNKVKLEAN